MNKSVLLAGIAALVLLVGCDDKPKPENAVKIYASIDECKADHDEQECQKAFEGAQTEHEKSVPRHATLGECVDRYGADACIPHHSSSGDWFGPAMAGFMIGHMLGTPSYQPVYIQHGYAYSGSNQLGSWRSTCVSCRTGGFVTVPAGSSPAWSRSYSTTTITPSGRGPSATYAPAPASTRGGFGGSASGIGKSSPSAPSSVASPGAASARGGFGGSAAGSSAGG